MLLGGHDHLEQGAVHLVTIDNQPATEKPVATVLAESQEITAIK